jgi:hypothetical protein
MLFNKTFKKTFKKKYRKKYGKKNKTIRHRKSGGGTANELKEIVSSYMFENNVSNKAEILNRITSNYKNVSRNAFIEQLTKSSFSMNAKDVNKKKELLNKLYTIGNINIENISFNELIKITEKEFLDFLLEKRFDPTKKSKAKGEEYSYMEYLEHYLSKRFLEVCKKHGFPIQNQALLTAISEKNIDMVHDLLKMDRDPNYGNPLLLAIKSNNEKIVQLLLEYGADPKRSIKQLTPYDSLIEYMIASLQDGSTSLNIFGILLKYGKYSAIILATFLDYVLNDIMIDIGDKEINISIAKLLINNGADLTQKIKNVRLNKKHRGDIKLRNFGLTNMTLRDFIYFLFSNVNVRNNVSQVHKLVNPSDVIVKFGVELEICVKLNSLCMNKAAENIRDKSWIELFQLYASSMFPKYKHVDKIREKYGYVYVTTAEKYGYSYIFDLTDFTFKEQKGKIAYDRPFFTIDRSVQCGDYLEEYSINSNNIEKIRDTFHIEFVSPILDSMEDLKELLEFVGLYRPECFVSNSSAGYHVNISLANKSTGEPINITRDFFKIGFYPLYKEWEKDMQTHSNEYAYRLLNIESNKNNVYERTAANKYVAVYRKSPYLYEFRIFGSNESIDVLIDYTKTATEMMMKAYTIWANTK